MSDENTLSHDSQGLDLDSQPASPLKRIHSPEKQESAKRHQQDPKLSAESRFEVAKEMFRQAGGQQLHITLDDLIEADASSQALEAAYSPFFKGLAVAIIGRDDIPVPPAYPYAGHFLAGDPAFQNYNVHVTNGLIESLIDY
ncbi:hypothetical protein C0992_009927, partial [Termitomyces sp. T32_za158]